MPLHSLAPNPTHPTPAMPRSAAPMACPHVEAGELPLAGHRIDRMERSRHHLSLGDLRAARREAICCHLELCEKALDGLKLQREGAQRLVGDWQDARDTAHAELMLAPRARRDRLARDLEEAETQLVVSRRLLASAEADWAEARLRLVPQIENLKLLLERAEAPLPA